MGEIPVLKWVLEGKERQLKVDEKRSVGEHDASAEKQRVLLSEIKRRHVVLTLDL